jgi:hypothetical protein
MRLRVKAPSAGLVVGGIALVVALSGTAYAVTTTQVNIADPGIPAHKAHVNAIGRLEVGDGSHLTPAGQKEVATAAPADAVVLEIDTDTCDPGGAYTPPDGKALIITGVTFFTLPIGSDREASEGLFSGSSAFPCAKLLAAAGTHTDETTPETFDPGIPVAAGQALGTQSDNNGGIFLVYGYLVPASAVPAPAAPASKVPSSARHHSARNPVHR